MLSQSRATGPRLDGMSAMDNVELVVVIVMHLVVKGPVCKPGGSNGKMKLNGISNNGLAVT